MIDHADRASRSRTAASPPRPAGPPPATFGEVDREDGRDDRRHHRRVRPVVHRPGPQLGPVQAERVEGAPHHASPFSIGTSRIERAPTARLAEFNRRAAEGSATSTTRCRPAGLVTDWSSAAIPSNRAPRAEAASAGASMMTRPSASRRIWSWEKSWRTSPASASAAGSGAGGLGRGSARPATGRVGATSARPSAAAATWSLRLVGGVEERLERVGDLVVEVERRRGRPRRRRRRPEAAAGGERGGVVELLDPGQERARLLELDRVALAVEEALEERLLRADEAGDPRLDPLLADEVVDVDRLLLAEPVDPADPLLEDGRVPGQLQVDHAVRGVLEVEPDAAGVAGEEDAERRVVVELDDVLGPPLLPLGPGEEPGAEAVSASRSPTAQCARVSIRRHWLKMTTLRPCSSTSCRTSWRSSSSLGADSPLMHALLGRARRGSPARPPRTGAGPGRWR